MRGDGCDPVVFTDPAGFVGARVEDAAVELGVAERTHFAFDASDVAAVEVDEKDVAGEEDGVGGLQSSKTAHIGRGF